MAKQNDTLVVDVQKSKQTRTHYSPVSLIRSLDKLHCEEELYSANEETTKIQGEGEGAQRQCHLVHNRILLRADQATRGHR